MNPAKRGNISEIMTILTDKKSYVHGTCNLQHSKWSSAFPSTGKAICLTKLKSFRWTSVLRVRRSSLPPLLELSAHLGRQWKNSGRPQVVNQVFSAPVATGKNPVSFWLDWSHHLKEAIPQRSFHPQFTWEIDPPTTSRHKFRFQKSSRLLWQWLKQINCLRLSLNKGLCTHLTVWRTVNFQRNHIENHSSYDVNGDVSKSMNPHKHL